ncbi:methyltransferase, FkbM family [Azospirillum oryzae]|uniref:Methyltransferase, FkbM family n=1 Tax=Azospirillum oryzae TaxID=286727 RepID=A0A1X7EZJ4_9PROT|nr:FkbM family methyltransferase [Azospirillum oryzae]SMF43156.1 methyltransferase, FkbM family [Azospirillum oryzae]
MAIKQTSFGGWVIEGDTHISKWAEERGRIDSDGYLLPHIISLIKTGDVVIDVGANIGDHTIAYLEAVGDEGTVYAFEPQPEAYECLIRNCGDRPTFFCAAALDQRKEVSINLLDNRGASFIVEGSGGISGFPIDDLEIDKVDLIKIDVEGAELKVLSGASRTISRCKPKIVIEINRGHLSRFECSPEIIFDWLDKFGYKWCPIHEDTDVVCSPQFDVLATPK